MGIYKVIIKKIDWLDIECQEAEVLFDLGDSQYWAFCQPCKFKEGETANVSLPFIMSNDTSLETLFSNNDKEMKIDPSTSNRLSYYCYGKITNINPVTADCGDILFDLGEMTHDERVIGEYVYFVVDRLDIIN